jgi:maleylpyruvate isomerase
MTTSLTVDEVLRYAAEAQQRLEDVVGRLTDADVGAPSALNGWTRGHVLAHLARNADSQVGMLEGVARDEIVAQYPGGDAQRDGDIEAGAGRSVADLLDDLETGHRRFLAAAAQLSGDQWNRHTLSRLGELPAWVTPWVRWREVEVHSADLGLAVIAGKARLSADFVARFFPPELDRLPGRLPPTESASGAVVDLTGEPAEQLLWLMGRAAPPVGLVVDGVVIDRSALTPWPLTQWIPGGP